MGRQYGPECENCHHIGETCKCGSCMQCGYPDHMDDPEDQRAVRLREIVSDLRRMGDGAVAEFIEEAERLIREKRRAKFPRRVDTYLHQDPTAARSLAIKLELDMEEVTPWCPLEQTRIRMLVHDDGKADILAVNDFAVISAGEVEALETVLRSLNRATFSTDGAEEILAYRKAKATMADLIRRAKASLSEP